MSVIENHISGYLYNEHCSENNEEKCAAFQSIAWSLIVHKNTIKNCSTALQAFSFRSLSLCIRSSHRSCSLKRGVLRDFAKLTEKHLCQSLLFNKVAGLQCCEISNNAFSIEHLQTTASVVSFISLFMKARVLLEFISLVFSILYIFSPFSFVLINALILPLKQQYPYK